MKYDYLSVNSNCSRICIGIHYSLPSDASTELCTFLFGISPAALKLGPERYCCVYLTVSFSFSLGVLIFFFPSQAIRNRVKTGVSGSRRSIDMVFSEYANFSPQSQHTLYVSPFSVNTRLR